MAQQTNGCGSGCGLGCGTLLGLMALALALLALVIYAVAAQGQQQKQRQLKELVAAADRRVRHDPCRVRESFGVFQSISLAGDLFTPRLDILCRTITRPSSQPELEENRISLSPPAEPQLLRSATGLASWLRGGGVTLLDDLSVEAKATRAAMECLREHSWTRDALVKLGGLRTSLLETLAKAKGNELLEPAIPQLQQALQAFEQEKEKLQQAHSSAGDCCASCTTSSACRMESGRS